MLQGMLYTVASTYERTSTTHFCYAVHVSLRLVLCSLSFIFTAGRGIQKKTRYILISEGSCWQSIRLNAFPSTDLM